LRTSPVSNFITEPLAKQERTRKISFQLGCQSCRGGPQKTAEMRGLEFPTLLLIPKGNAFVRRGRGRPKSATTKEQISVRLDPDVLAALRAAGPGWQSQINVLLRQALRVRKPAAKRVA